MSGVWVFKNGVMRLVENPAALAKGGRRRRKALVYLPTGEVITSYRMLEEKLAGLGWVRYVDNLMLLQFHKESTIHLISLPREFADMQTMHMYDVVVKCRNAFEVRDISG